MGLITNVISILCLVLHLTLASRIEEPKEFDSDKNVLNRDPKWAHYNAFREEMSTRNLAFFNISQLTCFDLITYYGNLKPDFTWEVSNITDKILQDTFTLKSEEFSWIGYPKIRTRAKMEGIKDDYVDMSIELEDEKAFNFNIRPQVYYLLRGQDEHGLPNHRCNSAIYPFHSTFNSSSMYKTQWTRQSIFNNNVNGTVVIEVYVEPSPLAHQVYSTDGTLNWAIDNYSLRMRSTFHELVPFQNSIYFYTGPRGYRVKVNMWLNGHAWFKDISPVGLSVQIGFVDGEFDHDLPTSFLYRTTVTLYSQSNANVILSKQVTMGMYKVDDYFIDVCSSVELDAFIENDSLYYSVSIEAIH